MQYHITQQVDGHHWERDQAAVIEDVRRQVEHDLAAQNPGSTVTLDVLNHTVRRTDVLGPSAGNNSAVLIDFVAEYTLRGQQNAFDA